MHEDKLDAAAAIALAGSSDYNTHAGATLTLLSRLAADGRLTEFSELVIAHSAVHPRDRRRLLKEVPSKILNQFLYRHHQCSLAAVTKWQQRHTDWADLLKNAVSSPAHFAALAGDMARQAKHVDGTREQPRRESK